MNNREINGLKLVKIKTKVELFKNFQPDNLKSFSKPAAVVAYMDYGILEGQLNNGGFSFEKENNFEWEYVQKMRIFNGQKELYIWRDSAGVFKARLRTDREGEERYVVEASQKLRNSDSSADRSIKTVSYIDYNELGQAGYVDSRFAEYISGEVNHG